MRKTLFLIILLFVTFLVTDSNTMNANEPLVPVSRMYYWPDYGGTGQPYVICSGMPVDCLPPIVVTPDE